jgi:hypothetical protein
MLRSYRPTASLTASGGGTASAGLARIIFGVTGSTGNARMFGSNVAGATINPALSMVDSELEHSPSSAFNFFGGFNSVAPGFSSGFQLASYSSSSTSLPTTSFSFRYASSGMPPSPMVPARSHATNRNDPSAGSRMENPIEIASDSEDDVIQIVELE